MDNFKKIKFQLTQGSVVSTMEGEDVSLDEAIRILKDPNIISVTVTRMTPKEYLKTQTPVNLSSEGK
jgi:hypothetical protein